MTVEILLYSIKGWTHKKHYLERVVLISTRNSNPEETLKEKAAEFKSQWSCIKKITWEKI